MKLTSLISVTLKRRHSWPLASQQHFDANGGALTPRVKAGRCRCCPAASPQVIERNVAVLERASARAERGALARPANRTTLRALASLAKLKILAARHGMRGEMHAAHYFLL